MEASIAFMAGIIIGVASGALLALWLSRAASKDTENIAETLSAKVLSRQTEHILALAETKLAGKKEVIDGTLRSMKDELNKVEKLIQEVGKGNAKIDGRLESAANVIKDLTETASGLRNALTSNSNRGQWGERMAEDVLRLAGMIEGINYIKQTKLQSSGSKPDFTFLLPQNQKLNMDVKFPFNNYQLYVESKTDSERERYKKEFLSDVKKRMKEVQTRDYINPEENTVDYVLLFIPNEQIFAFINEIDRPLIDEAMRAKTIFCSPLSLYAILAVIRQAMDNFRMEAKSMEMLSLFGAFKQQWEKFKDQMETVKDRFELVHKGYEELTGARERQLERPLQKIEELRLESGSAPEQIEETFAEVSRKKIAAAR